MCIGLFWLTGIVFFQKSRDSSQLIYHAATKQIEYTDKEAQSFEFVDDLQKAKYLETSKEFKKSLAKFKKTNVDRIPLTGIVVSIVCFLTGTSYILAGVKILKRSTAAKQFIRWGIAGFLLHFILVFCELTISFGAIHTQDLYSYFLPEQSSSIFDSPFFYMLPYLTIFLAILYIFNVLLPRLFLSRAIIRSQLK